MTRGTRLTLVFCLFLGVVLLMMDCAKKTMKRKKQVEGVDQGGQGWLVPGEAFPSCAFSLLGPESGSLDIPANQGS
jgi:hypothetical protein